MKSPFILLTALLLTAASFQACDRQTCNNNDNGKSAVRHTESIDFDAIEYQASYRLLKSADDYFRDSDLVYTDSISLVIPRDKPGRELAQLRDSILSMAFGSYSHNIDSLITAFVADDARQFSYSTEAVPSVGIDSADGYQWVSGSIVNYNPSLLVYEVANSTYSPGAAHGVTSRNYINYDLVKNRILNGNLMFASDKRVALAAMINRRAAEMADVIGPTQIDALPENDNYYIDPEGEIVFVYQPYEVASYAQGLISISFYPVELAEYLTPEAMQYFSLDDMN